MCWTFKQCGQIVRLKERTLYWGLNSLEDNINYGTYNLLSIAVFQALFTVL